MTSVFGGFGKRGTTGLAAGSVVPGFPYVLPGLPGRVSPTEVSFGNSWRIGGACGTRYGLVGVERLALCLGISF
jgi:hypothetical protein